MLNSRLYLVSVMNGKYIQMSLSHPLGSYLVNPAFAVITFYLHMANSHYIHDL